MFAETGLVLWEPPASSSPNTQAHADRECEEVLRAQQERIRNREHTEAQRKKNLERANQIAHHRKVRKIRREIAFSLSTLGGASGAIAGMFVIQNQALWAICATIASFALLGLSRRLNRRKEIKK